MFLTSHATHVRVVLDKREWKCLDGNQMYDLERLAVRYYTEQKFVRFLFSRSDWPFARDILNKIPGQFGPQPSLN